MIALLLAACTPDYGTVTMNGLVHDAPDAAGNLVGGATLTVVDGAQAEIDQTTTSGDGSFEIATPAGEAFFLELTGEGYVSTSFSGTAGMSDFSAGDGYPWIATPEWITDLRAEFANCPNVDAGGGVVAGEVRQYVEGISSLQSLPAVGSGMVTVSAEGVEEAYTACYLDESGASVADAADTGPDGKFAVFGVPPGGVVVEVVYQDSDLMYPSVLYSFVLGNDGFVPLYPALVYEGDL